MYNPIPLGNHCTQYIDVLPDTACELFNVSSDLRLGLASHHMSQNLFTELYDKGSLDSGQI
jgi:hypothetical protein